MNAFRRRIAIAIVLVLVVVGGGLAARRLAQGPPGPLVTAMFPRTVGVYAGSDVRILGVRVGTVHAITPVGDQVRVVLRLDPGVPVPADADAVVIAPSVVSDRYVQLTPAYTGGPKLAGGAVIPPERTAIPAEVDDLYSSLTKLADALGPNGANANGALSDLLNTTAENLSGNGQALGTTIAQLGKLAKTLNGNSPDFFTTVHNLSAFSSTLAADDADIRGVEDKLASVTGFLAGDKNDLAGALSQLGTALGQVKTFIEDNRAALKTQVDKLSSITQSLVDQRESVAEALDVAPLAVDDVLNAYDPAHGTLDGRADINELSLGGGAPLPLPH
jgi:phospholipid/cholesterol/gamma-HCH transport system substrate-binding protein